MRRAAPLVLLAVVASAVPLVYRRTPPPPSPTSSPASCETAPPRLVIAEPDRNLLEIEAISNALKALTKGDFCPAVTAFQFDKLSASLAPDVHVQRLFPSRSVSVVDGSQGAGMLVNPERPECFGNADDFVADMRSLVGQWRTVERCSFEPFRIFVTKDATRRAAVDLHLWLGGVDEKGGRVSEKGDVAAELEETAEGSWRFTRLQFGERQRFRGVGQVFADRTESARLPTAWQDEGYEPDNLQFGQILYGGVATGDYDGDGWADLYISRAGRNFLFRNDGHGHFEDVSERAGVADPGNSQAALFADLDNDGDQDLVVVNAWYSLVLGPHSKRGHQVYRNNGDGTFQLLPASLGPIGPASGISAADFDNDGLVDLYVTYYQDEHRHPYHHFVEARDGFGNHLYRNRGNLRFDDVTRTAGVGGTGWSYASAWVDFDEDRRIDLYVANDFGDNALFRNRGDGTFEEIAAKAGVNDPANGMSADWGDYDNDGHFDLYIANMYSKTGNQFLPLYPDLGDEIRRKLQFAVQGNSLYRNRGNGTFEETGRRLGVNLAGWAWGSNFFDYDNDGWLDLHVANGFWAGPSDADA